MVPSALLAGKNPVSLPGIVMVGASPSDISQDKKTLKVLAFPGSSRQCASKTQHVQGGGQL